MKKALVSTIAVAIMALVFVSCGNNGGKKADNAAKGIVGSWYYSDNTYYTFNEDGTGSYTAFGALFGNFTYTEGDGKLTLNYAESTEPTVFNYKLEGETLTILAGESNLGSDTEYKRK